MLEDFPILYIQMIALVILLGLSSFFSSFETAITSLTKIQVHQLIKSKAKNAEYVEKLKTNLNKAIIAILIGNNLVNISASALATIIATEIFGSGGLGIAIGVLTLLVLVFGEITPKSYATQNADKLACSLSKLFYYLMIVLSPVIWVLARISNVFIRMIGGKVGEEPEVTPETIKAIAELGAEEGVIKETEKQIIHRVVEFNNSTAGEIMTPRINMFAIDLTEKPAKIKKKLQDTHYSRIPVYKGTRDNMRGILLVREFLKKYSPRMSLRRVMKPAYFVTEEEKVDILLREMQKKNIHFAVVLDPHGGVAGIVTLEDILEELVGEIYDETDVTKHLMKHLDSHTIDTDADIRLQDVDEALKISLPPEKVSSFGSLNEFLLNKLNHIPKQGEIVTVGNVSIEIRKVNRRKIEEVRIHRKR